MKSLASVLGMGPLALILGGALLYGAIANSLPAMYWSAMSAQGSGAGAQEIVQAALNIAIHISGPAADKTGKPFTYYNTNDGKTSPYPNFDQQKLLQVWSQHGVALNDVQCAGFVSATLAMANHPMVNTLDPAILYWNGSVSALPAATWERVPAGMGAPMPGDVAVFASNPSAKNPGPGPGHVAIVVAVNPAAAGKGGNVVFAQANWPPNFYTPDARVPWITTPGIPLYAAPFSLDNNIDMSNHTLLGFIRNIDAQKQFNMNLPAVGSTGAAKSLPNSPWVQIAESDAVANGIDPILFARQINQESGFNPNSFSDAGAIGIAQFLPGTAKGMGIDPHDPAQSLSASARMMADSYRHYLSASSSPQDAYAKALAAYNCGGGCVNNVVSTYGSAWMDHLPLDKHGRPQTRDYIRSIMGI
jgi:soluble lytic murein transglycosylase-like protein